MKKINVLQNPTETYLEGLVLIPSKNLEFQRHISWSLFLFYRLRWEMVFCWNCWPSLFKLSFHIFSVVYT